MTSWEPYPQAKMTRAQEQAYAERRRAATSGAKTASRSSTSGRKRRIVRTAAGARRYKVPIGSEIGTARNAESAKWQKDKESTNRYRSLVGGSPQAQAATLRKVHNGALQRLARVAYSFKSSDPNVVKLRISVANEMRRRGMNVNDYGGLGPKTKNPGPAGTWARDHAKRVAARKKTAAKSVKAKKAAPKKPVRKVTPARSAMSARKNDRRLIEMSVPQLRAAVRVFPRIPIDKRQAVARVLVRRALELSAPHFLGDAVIEAANLPDPQKTRVIELVGKWKHGWIPLDGAAVSAKMKGGKGKPWWNKGGSGGTKGRLHAAVGVPKTEATNYGRERGRHKSIPERTNQGKTVKYPAGSPVISRAQAEDMKARGKGDFLAKQTNPSAMTDDQLRKADMDAHNRGRASTAGRTDSDFDKKVRAELRRRGLKGYRAHDDKGNHPALNRSAPGHKTKVATDRTAVVKSGPKPKEGPKMSANKPEVPRGLAASGVTLGGKVRSPEGTEAYSLKGGSLYDTMLVRDGQVVGYTKKRSGNSTVGRSGAATYRKNTGYATYDASGRNLGTRNTRADALESLSHFRNPGKA